MPGPKFRRQAPPSQGDPDDLSAPVQTAASLEAADAPIRLQDGPDLWRADLDVEVRRLEAEGKEAFIYRRLKQLAWFLAKEFEVLAMLAHLEDELKALWGKHDSTFTPPDQRESIRAGIAVVEDLLNRCRAYLKSPPTL